MDTLTDSSVVCKTGHGVELHSTLLRFSRRQIVLEIYDPHIVLQMSEVLNELKITLNQRLVYSGKAVIRNLVNTGTTMICEAALEDKWQDETDAPGQKLTSDVQQSFHGFVQYWQKNYKIKPEYKVLVADMQTFLIDLRLWLDQIEL